MGVRDTLAVQVHTDVTGAPSSAHSRRVLDPAGERAVRRSGGGGGRGSGAGRSSAGVDRKQILVQGWLPAGTEPVLPQRPVAMADTQGLLSSRALSLDDLPCSLSLRLFFRPPERGSRLHFRV